MKIKVIVLSLFAVAVAAAVTTKVASSPVKAASGGSGGVGVWDGRRGGESLVFRAGTSSAARINSAIKELHIMWKCAVPVVGNPPSEYSVVERAQSMLNQSSWTTPAELAFWNDVKALKAGTTAGDKKLEEAVDSILKGESIWTARAYEDTNLVSGDKYIALEIYGPDDGSVTALTKEH